MPLPNGDIRIIQQQGQATLIEWIDADGTHREIASCDLSSHQLGTGIPYGVTWSGLKFYNDFPYRLELLLHQYDIWTWDDFANHTNEVRLAFLRAGLQEMKKEARHE